MKLHAFALLAGLLPALAFGQAITNSSFEYDGTPEDGNHNYWGNGSTPTISQATDLNYLPGWTITRNDSWQYDWDGPTGPGVEETHQVNVYNTNATLYPENPYSGYNGASVIGGPNSGPQPFDAVDGSLYLIFYNDHSPASLTTMTTASTVASGLVAGQTYRVDYWYAGIGWSNTGEYNIDLQVKADGASVALHDVLAFNEEPVNPGPETGVWETDNGAYNAGVYTNWKQGSAYFQAGSATSVLSFIGLMQGGPAQLQLDHLTLTQVPEPGSYGLVACGLVCLLMVRRRRMD